MYIRGKMQNAEANKIIDSLLQIVESDGIQPDKLIEPLQKAREFALAENDPLVTRALRLAWQHIESNEEFQVAFLEEAETQEENLSYFLSLVRKSDNTYNRDELREMTNILQAQASA